MDKAHAPGIFACHIFPFVSLEEGLLPLAIEHSPNPFGPTLPTGGFASYGCGITGTRAGRIICPPHEDISIGFKEIL